MRNDWYNMENSAYAPAKLGVVISTGSSKRPIYMDNEEGPCRHERAAIVEALLQSDKVDVNSKNIRGRTPLWAAVALGPPSDIIRLLLRTGKVDPDLEDDDGRTAISYAQGEWKSLLLKESFRPA
jgi:ankyrin repeat protein